MSDKNLENDKFFNEKIREDLNGYVEIQLLQLCNKIKALSVTEDEIKEAIKSSDLLEMDPIGLKFRRKNNSPIPTLKLLNKKRKAEENKDDIPEGVDPFIIEISTSASEIPFKWQKIQEEFKSANSNVNVVYIRFKENSGHIGVYKKSAEEEIKFTEDLEIEGINFTFKKCEGDNLINFWKEHGSHFEFCLGKNKQQKPKKQFDKNRLKTPVTLGNEVFNEVSKIRARTRNVLMNTKDWEKVKEDDQEFLVDLLKYHHNYEEKAKDLDYFTAAAHSSHSYSRCFYIVAKDSNQTKSDVSINKCIERLVVLNEKKN
jgi:hypothetical protein